MIADIISNKRLNPPIVTESFIKDRKLNISLVFITQFYFQVPNDLKLNCTHIFIMKITNQHELQQIAYNHSSDIDFVNLCKICTAKPFSFLVIDTTLTLQNFLSFRNNILEKI